MFPQNAAPRGVSLALAGSVTGMLEPLSAPLAESGNRRTEPDFNVTAAQLCPATICAPEPSVRATTPPSTLPEGHEWLSAQFALSTNACRSFKATESGCAQSE